MLANELSTEDSLLFTFNLGTSAEEISALECVDFSETPPAVNNFANEGKQRALSWFLSIFVMLFVITLVAYISEKYPNGETANLVRKMSRGSSHGRRMKISFVDDPTQVQKKKAPPSMFTMELSPPHFTQHDSTMTGFSMPSNEDEPAAIHETFSKQFKESQSSMSDLSKPSKGPISPTSANSKSRSKLRILISDLELDPEVDM